MKTDISYISIKKFDRNTIRFWIFNFNLFKMQHGFRLTLFGIYIVHLQNFAPEYTVYSVFRFRFFGLNEDSNKYEWMTEYRFFEGYLSDVNIDAHPELKAIFIDGEIKRFSGVFMGVTAIGEFPVKYPLIAMKDNKRVKIKKIKKAKKTTRILLANTTSEKAEQI